MAEIIVNTHIHSTLSDGSGSYAEIARAAIASGVDVLIITDHNVFPAGLEGYYREGDGRVLILTGEEIHNPLDPDQKNHLLVFNPHRDYAYLAGRHQVLLNAIAGDGGLSFIAHPVEAELPSFGEPDISWVDWSIHGFNGIELWNGMSEIKHISPNALAAVFYALFPAYLAHHPHPRTVEIWDKLLNKGTRAVAICGADAHQLVKHIGPVKKLIYPYQYHFQALNNHLLLPEPLGGKIEQDKKMIFDALRQGALFIGYDLPHSTRGFVFNAHGANGIVGMGGEISAQGGVTFQISTPAPGKVLLYRDGKVIQRWKGARHCALTTSQPGVYRVEVWISYLGRRRAWIISNPIFVVK
mgnify:CR=1 FL=1